MTKQFKNLAKLTSMREASINEKLFDKLAIKFLRTGSPADLVKT